MARVGAAVRGSFPVSGRNARGGQRVGTQQPGMRATPMNPENAVNGCNCRILTGCFPVSSLPLSV